MQIAFWHSNLGGSPLMVGLQRGLEALGHNVVQAHSNGEYDLLVVWNQIAHNPSYVYPDFPIRSCPIAFIDGAEYGYFRRLPGIVKCYANAFSEGSINHDTKNRYQQERLKQFLEGKSFPYFIREKSKYINWPDSYHPIDYPLYKMSEDHEPPKLEEYLRRRSDFFLSWGASHPWRWGITNALRTAGYPVLVLEEETESGKTPRMNQPDYFRLIRGAKASASFDGYGSGSFRMTEILCRTVLLQGPLTIETREPLIDGETCVAYDVESEGEEFLGTNIVERLQWVLECPERAFEIYQRGFEHVHSKLSETATARYVLEIAEKHDWTKPTQLDI